MGPSASRQIAAVCVCRTGIEEKHDLIAVLLGGIDSQLACVSGGREEVA
jgi:hypothetical protein